MLSSDTSTGAYTSPLVEAQEERLALTESDAEGSSVPILCGAEADLIHALRLHPFHWALLRDNSCARRTSRLLLFRLLPTNLLIRL